ncbi:MAG: hypothetical protein IH908_14170, partial [Proteobacteria bacterium]|nr:hypothetical protein [Pseudomonadota bacterium]
MHVNFFELVSIAHPLQAATVKLRLSVGERRRLDQFLESTEGVQLEPGITQLVAGSFSMIGLLLVIATTFIAVDGLYSVGSSSFNASLMWMYVFGIGVVWTVLQVIVFGTQGTPLTFDQNTLLFGLTAGVLLAIANILLIESLTHIDVSLGSTIYRLNTIGVVLLSFWFLSEPLGLL